MRYYKKIIGCVLTGAMVLALSGCSQNGQPGQAAEAQQSQAGGEEAQATEEQASRTGETESRETEDAGKQESAETETAAGSGESQGRTGNTLVIYFSATQNTEKVAGYIADALDADTYEIVPEEPYTSDDLDWTDDSSRVSEEHRDPDARPAISEDIADIGGYDTIFLGYPLWWGVKGCQ